MFGDKADDVDRGKAQGVEGYMYMVLSEAFESFEHKIPRHSGPESRPAVASFGRRKVESMVQVLYLGEGGDGQTERKLVDGGGGKGSDRGLCTGGGRFEGRSTDYHPLIEWHLPRPS